MKRTRHKPVAEGFSVGVQIIRKLRQAEQMLNEGQAQGLLEVCPIRSCPAVAPVVAFAGTAPASWIPSPPPRLLRQAI